VIDMSLTLLLTGLVLAQDAPLTELDGEPAVATQDDANLETATRIANPLAVDKVLDAMHAALGGQSLDEAKTLQTTISQKHWDFSQARDWGEEPAYVGVATTTVTHDFRGGMHLALSPRPIYPAQWKWDYEETYRSDKACGFRRGTDEYGGKKSAPTPAGRIGYRTKLAKVASVWLLDRLVVREEVTDWHGVATDGPLVLSGTWHGAPVTLTLDPSSHLPLSFAVIEDNAIMGDIPYVVSYADWTTVSGGQLPQKLVHTVAGHVYQRDQHSDFTLDVDADFQVADKHCEDVDLAEVELGHHRAQFLMNFTLKGFLKDHDLFDHSVSWEEFEPGVFLAAGPLYSSMVVDLGDQVVVTELPFSTERSAALLDLVAAKLPGKPITHVVNSHLHHDHFGGLRAAVARGIPVVLAPNKVEALTQYAAAPKTLVTDEQSVAGNTPQIITVDEDTWELKGSERSLVVHKIDVRHGGDMLMVYVPDTKSLFIADLFSPGIPPTKGLGGSIGRLAIGALFPVSKQTFTDWAGQLVEVLEDRNLAPERIVGGHGAYAATLKELHTVVKWGE
jgi:glyoxylase-like metal-dependent hydrolase (beta-lactamase superfamily II)